MKPVLRCSELDRVLACPGSRVLTSLVAPRLGDEGAAGTNIHADIADRLNVAGSRMRLMNPFDQWVSDFCVREVLDNAPSDWSLECEGEYAYEFDDFVLTGHPDAVAINPDVTEAKGWDYKTGNVAVDPAEVNEQVLGYIVLLLRAYPTLRKITFFIVQPRNDEDEGFERVSEVCIIFDDELTPGETFKYAFESRIKKTLNNSQEVNSGRKQCRFCSAVLQCPAIKAEIENMKSKLTPEIMAKISKEPDDAFLADMVVAGRTVAAASEQAERILHERLDKQPAVKSDSVTITRVEQGGRFSVKDAPGIFAAMKGMFPERVIANVVSYPTGKIKDAIAEQYKVKKTGVSGNTAQSIFDAKFAGMFEQGKRRVLIFT